MGYFGRKGDFKAVAAHVRDMSSRGVVGDVFTFSTILSALLRAGREDAPEMMVNFMKKQGIEPNVATYSAIIDQQMREQSEDNLRAALRLLEGMERDPRTQPNEVTYTAILAGLYRGQWLDPGMAEEHRQDIMGRMHSRGIRPNRVTYNILLKACLANSEPEGLQNALRYHREMVSRRMLLDYDTWFILLRGLTDRGEWEIAGEMTREMVLSGFQPMGTLAEVVKRIRKQTIGRVKVKPSE
jgi:pentatricopeptide repeat protein